MVLVKFHKEEKREREEREIAVVVSTRTLTGVTNPFLKQTPLTRRKYLLVDHQLLF